MNDHTRAEEDLPVIQTLLERAPSYRAASARGALVFGLLSVLAATAIYLNGGPNNPFGRGIRGRDFAVVWLLVFVASLIGGVVLLAAEAHRQGRLLFGPTMRMALRVVAPYLIIPAAFTGWFLTTGYLGGQELDLVVVWIAFYGLSLLSTSLFGPGAISLLGWAFLISSLAIPAVVNTLEANFTGDVPNLIAGFTFGLYHLVYAGLNWRRRRQL